MATVQIRDVPDDVHRALRARAAAAGVSLSDYAREVLGRAAARPSSAELAARIAARGVVEPAEPTQDAVRALRERGE